MIQKVARVNSDSQKSLGQKWIQGEADDIFFYSEIEGFILFYFIFVLGCESAQWQALGLIVSVSPIHIFEFENSGTSITDGTLGRLTVEQNW